MSFDILMSVVDLVLSCVMSVCVHKVCNGRHHTDPYLRELELLDYPATGSKSRDLVYGLLSLRFFFLV